MAEHEQPRDEHGRFTSGGGLGTWASARAPKMAERLLSRAEKSGGFSYRPDDPNPQTGFMVSLPTSAGHNHVVSIEEMAKRPDLTEKDARAELKSQITKWLQDNLTKLQHMPQDHYLGGWLQRHNETGTPVAMHFDVSQRMQDKDKAIAAGKDRNQMAIWHLNKKQEISTGGTGT